MVRMLMFGVCISIVAVTTAEPPLPFLIGEAKMSTVPVLVRDTSWDPKKEGQGTAVIIGDIDSTGSRWLALTCAHVVAADTDAAGLPARPASGVTLGIPSEDFGDTLLNRIPARMSSPDRSGNEWGQAPYIGKLRDILADSARRLDIQPALSRILPWPDQGHLVPRWLASMAPVGQRFHVGELK